MEKLLKLKQPKYLLSLLVVFLLAGFGAVEKELFGSSARSPNTSASLEELSLKDPRISEGSTESPMDAFAKERATPFRVVKVIDGDTIIVSADGKEITVRLIGINAPETEFGLRPQECFGKESTEHLRSILPVGTMVGIDTDASQGLYDKYQRLLAYVMLADHTNVALQMIADGYVYEYTYDKPYLYSTGFKDYEATARKEKKGLWADGACGMKNI